MSTENDLREFLRVWSELSLLNKVILGGNLIASTLAIASITDGVVKLVGFISVAIEFYRKIVEPFTEFVNRLFDFGLEQVQADSILFLTFLNASKFRSNRILYMRKPE